MTSKIIALLAVIAFSAGAVSSSAREMYYEAYLGLFAAFAIIQVERAQDGWRRAVEGWDRALSRELKSKTQASKKN